MTLVSDYAPGIDAEKSFKETFTDGGGEIVEDVKRAAAPIPTSRRSCSAWRTPSPTRCSCSCRRAQGGNFMKQYAERGLDKAGIKLIGPGDVTDDDLLNGMGDAALGAVTAHHLFGGASLRREQGVRRGLQEGQQRHAAELHGGRRL